MEQYIYLVVVIDDKGAAPFKMFLREEEAEAYGKKLADMFYEDNEDLSTLVCLYRQNMLYDEASIEYWGDLLPAKYIAKLNFAMYCLEEQQNTYKYIEI